MTREQHLYIKSQILAYKKSFNPFFYFSYTGILLGAIYCAESTVIPTLPAFSACIIGLLSIFYLGKKVGSDMHRRLKEYPLDNTPVNMEELLANPVFGDLF